MERYGNSIKIVFCRQWMRWVGGQKKSAGTVRCGGGMRMCRQQGRRKQRFRKLMRNETNEGCQVLNSFLYIRYPH
jgi:hypothetical protein